MVLVSKITLAELAGMYMRPSQNNHSMGVDSAETRALIMDIVSGAVS